MRLVITVTTALTLFAIALPGMSPVFAQESEVSERWLTMGKTQKGDILSLNVNSVQTKPQAGCDSFPRKMENVNSKCTRSKNSTFRIG